MSQHRFVRHRWDNPGRTSHGSNNLWITFSIQTYESVFAVLSSGMFWLQMGRDSLWRLCEGEARGNWRVWRSSMVHWVDSYLIAHISLLQVLLVSDTVKGRAVAIQGLWNCTHTCTHLCLKDLFWLLIFLLTHSVFCFDLDFGPRWEFEHTIRAYLPKHCCTNISFYPTNGKIIKPESSFHHMSQKHILLKYRMKNMAGFVHCSSF